MEFQHERERIFALDEQGKLVAEVTFPVSEGVADIDHTFVEQSLRAQGVAGQLLDAAVRQIRWRACVPRQPVATRQSGSRSTLISLICFNSPARRTTCSRPSFLLLQFVV